ncbi:hypothetical protein KC367_g2040 [Hortaea werneckii]|nr:hypothetical protein KC342_g1548 [Hortaea werneckii]KAI7108572.1 hypothetical protein KC339_g1419 [Hortaea werneckii]KAI7245501.1 hypothetical protein KC365_g408 [Hortaea werneckii]KAI7339383.1 hypothetical protein KC340_g597 [Hortaea werneckii]KAI7370754.1 hypothetical protein KC354_g1025 [Hortaea werneckii]
MQKRDQEHVRLAQKGKKAEIYAAVEFPDDDLLDDAADNAKSDAAVGRRMGDDYEEATDEEDSKALCFLKDPP